jgi:hypothetical protein
MQYNYDKLALKKYKAILHRSFKTKLELFLFNQCVQGITLTTIDSIDFLKFNIPDPLIALYERAWQMEDGLLEKDHSFTVKEIDSNIISWNKSNIGLKALLLNSYSAHFQSEVFKLEDFKLFYLENSKDRKCYYCGTDEQEIEILRQKSLIKTKRFRGYEMEVDRKNSNKEYFLLNVNLCCYWCNNAKSDEYSEAEFRDFVAPGIKKVWSHRLGESKD